MNNFSEQIYDSHFSLNGRHLISASAGTGKTYSIQSLYLRYILLENYTVGQILVVTFTKAATRELKSRLRKILQETADVLQNRGKGDDRIRNLLALMPDEKRHDAELRILQALQDFDAAPIFTIHGFCNRVLTRYAFETGQSFDAEPAENSDEELEKLNLDWWRRNVYNAEPEFYQFLLDNNFNFEMLAQLSKMKVGKPDAVFYPSAEEPGRLLEKLQEQVRTLCQNEPPMDSSDQALAEFHDRQGIGKPSASAIGRIRGCLQRIAEFREQIGNSENALTWKDLQDFVNIDWNETFSARRIKYVVLETYAEPWYRLIQEIRPKLSTFLLNACSEIAKNYQTTMGSRDTTTFNDYLYNLREALKGPGGDTLKYFLREEFKVALIDEFQDTDPVQWGIFSAIFSDDAGDSSNCFLIGDPKQAIYRFRDGDITTYLKAAEGVSEDKRHELTRNFRSEENVIRAVNEIFRDRNGEFTFRHRDIAYPGTLQAQGKPPEESLTIGGQIDPQPFRILRIEKNIEYSYYRTAEEIAALLNDDDVQIGGEPVKPGQIAVLVNRHTEADAIAALLRERKIPVVQQATGNIWETPEAFHLLQLLNAVLYTEESLNNLRAILLMPAIGYRPEELRLLNDGGTVHPSWRRPKDDLPGDLNQWIIFFRDMKELWLQSGFSAMFQALTGKLHFQRRFAHCENGQRVITNYRHLADLIQQELLQVSRTPDHVFDWIRQKISSGNGGDQGCLRVESDDDAVQIMTIFASKGLEFPVVFIPTLTFRKTERRQQKIYEVHNAENRLTISLVKQDGCLTEIEDELIRLAYVAFTRAVHRVVVFHAPESGGFLNFLMDRNFDAPDSCVQVRTDANSGMDTRTQYVPRTGAEAPVLANPPELPKISDNYRHSSFSSLAAASDQPVRDHDESARQEEEEDNEAPRVMDSIFRFPSGAKTGTCWHEIFEDLDFTASEAELRSLVQSKLQFYNFIGPRDASTGEPSSPEDRQTVDCISEMTEQTLAAPLPAIHPGTPEFTLRNITLDNRISEWEFNFATGRNQGNREPQARDIIRLLKDYPEYYRLISQPDSRKWNRTVSPGYVTGFMDLLFRVDGTYFIVDWKSNCRNKKTSDFAAAGLEEEISLHHYWLQFLLYAAALHQFLKHALPDYCFDRHFGGIYYIFLRGYLNEETHGIYASRPPEKLLTDLSNLLGDFS